MSAAADDTGMTAGVAGDLSDGEKKKLSGTTAGMDDREDDDAVADGDDDKDFAIRQAFGCLVTLSARLKTVPGTGHCGTA